MGKLSGKSAIVTGGASGMGRGVALAFAEEGANVAILDQNLSGAQTVAEEAAQHKVKTLGLSCDVGSEESIKKAFGESTTLGSIDILVNNAGIDTTEMVEDMSTEMWDDMMRINLKSIFLCCREAIPSMKQNKWGRIINFSSQLAHKGAPLMAHYCASKAGVMGFTRSLAYELIEFGITVNCINPGPIETPLYMGIPEDWRRAKEESMPIRRPGRVEEVVPTVLLLASNVGSFYVGASMNMNGGDVMV